MKRFAIIASIILAACVGGALLVAFVVVGAPASLSPSSSASTSTIPPPPTSNTPASVPALEITNSAIQDDSAAESEAEAAQPPLVPYEGGTTPAAAGNALEGSWHYYENSGDAPITAYQYRFYNESSNMNLNYGELGASIGMNMLGDFSLAGDGTLLLSNLTWSSKDNMLGYSGGQAVFTLGWPTDGQGGLVITMQSYETGNGERIAAFDHILGVPLLCVKFGEQPVDLG